MADNAYIVFDMEKQKKLDPGIRIDERLTLIKEDIDQEKRYIQPATEDELAFCANYKKQIQTEGPMYTYPLYKVTDNWIQCGTCVQICPRGCIKLEDNKVIQDYSNCINCMACIQACSTLAIQFETIDEPNPNARYRNPNIQLTEIISANKQERINEENSKRKR